MMIFSWN
nr:unnamed protein product [Callosobruchus analis]